LGAVRLAGDNDGFLITRSTFDATLTTRHEVEAEGEMAVPAERLMDLVKHFPADAELIITADEKAATIASGKSRFRLPVFPVAGLPAQLVLGEETGRAELDAEIARDLFSRPAFAASTEQSRWRQSRRGRHRWLPALPSYGTGQGRALVGSVADHPKRDGENH
jgi:DNA polymerase III sliding clamp (beta) subunit (PCNA family)